MKHFFLVLAAIILSSSRPTFGQNSFIPITGGRFFMQRGVSDSSNARIETANFTAISRVSDTGANSVFDICSISSNPAFCSVGTTFSVPLFPTVQVGFCGACNPPQFPQGTFTIDGTTYQNAYFNGQFEFSQARFSVLPAQVSKRKGFVRFRQPFTMTGNLQVCRTVAAADSACRSEDVIYNNQIFGHGTLTVKAKIILDSSVSARPFLQRESIEYKFEPLSVAE